MRVTYMVRDNGQGWFGHSPLGIQRQSCVRRPSVNCSESVHRSSQHSRPSRLPMEVVSATSAIVGLAVPVFQSAKALRDRIKLVRYPHPLRTLRVLIGIFHPCSQVASEKSELVAALTEYEKDINLLESLYNDNKELLDQYKLDTDLKELAEYLWSYFPFAACLTMAQNHTRPGRMAEFDQPEPGQEEASWS